MMDRPAESAANERDDPVVRRRVVYSGRVQGVGFRARTMHAARRFAVTGWVRNRIDGDVELVVEGAREQIDAFLGEVSLRMASNIEKVVMHEELPTGALQGFSVKD
jgi:acylphosphatase